MKTKLCSKVLTNFCQGGHKDPESDDEGDLNSLKLHVEDVILRGVSMVATGSVVAQFSLKGILRAIFK